MTKIEEVANAIYSKRNGAGARPWYRLEKAHKAPYLDDARAAIEAMREPTEEMDQAGYDAPCRALQFLPLPNP